MDLKLRNWLPAFAIMTAIFVLSSVPGSVINNAGLGNETYHVNGHFVMFIFLCFGYYKATKNIFASIFLTVIFGILDELHQMWTPFRSSSLWDIFVDSFGGIVAAGILWKQNLLIPKILKTWLNN